MQSVLILLMILTACQKGKSNFTTYSMQSTKYPNMVKIPAQTFNMGSNFKASYPSERPAHLVKINSFWIDATEVTNRDFKKFVKSTKYVTLAEKRPDWNKSLEPASLVFTPREESFWKWVPGASWKAPFGPDSNLDELMDHPVVHVALADAKAYCRWQKKRLPTEAEWELAAKGKLENTQFAWGNEFTPNGQYFANTFQGDFPKENSGCDGFEFTSPVRSFPPNGYGLYDMIGNVWEWTSDLYDAEYYQYLNRQRVLNNPRGSKRSYDPYEPESKKHVIKGGSFLCAENYCVNYRPSARLGANFDSGASHIGFRCVTSND